LYILFRKYLLFPHPLLITPDPANSSTLSKTLSKTLSVRKKLAHERLEVCRVGLEFIGWLNGLHAGAERSSWLFCQVDKAGTSLVLNLAKGNGRYPERDRRNFMDIAEASAVMELK
jgi:hypothetical protein